MISIITSNTRNADGQLWEIKCAKDEGIPVIGIYGSSNHTGSIPSDCGYVRIMDWTWSNIANWLRTLQGENKDAGKTGWQDRYHTCSVADMR